jgi:hypothetical protein
VLFWLSGRNVALLRRRRGSSSLFHWLAAMVIREETQSVQFRLFDFFLGVTSFITYAVALLANSSLLLLSTASHSHCRVVPKSLHDGDDVIVLLTELFPC